MKQDLREIKISIVICTHNRAEVLGQSLPYYKKLSEPVNYEILVVTNCCTDHTIEVVTYWQTKLPKLRQVDEPRLGHSHARNKGYQEANGNFIFYIDDDAYPHHNILTPLLECSKNGLQAATGRTLCWSKNSPKWILPSYVESLHYGDSLAPLPPGGYINGCVAGFSKQALLATDGFNPAFGMTGKKIGYFDEVDLQLKLEKKGYTVFYHPDLIVYHQSHNKTVRDFLKSAYLKGAFRRKAGESSRWRSAILCTFTSLRGLLIFVFKLFSSGWKPALKESFTLPAIYLGQTV